MTAAVEDVAAALLDRIGLPRSMVDTLVQNSAAGSCIRLMIAPELIGRLAPLPYEFMGYRILMGDIPRAAAPGGAPKRGPLRAAWRALHRLRRPAVKPADPMVRSLQTDPATARLT